MLTNNTINTNINNGNTNSILAQGQNGAINNVT
jgi:hypothetical protein